MFKYKLKKAVGRQIVLNVDDEITKTNSGIIIPKTAENRAMLSAERGLVVDIGKECFKHMDYDEPLCLEGDVVLIRPGTGIPFKDEVSDKVFRIVSEDDVLAILEKLEVN